MTDQQGVGSPLATALLASVLYLVVAGGLRLLLGKPPRQKPAIVSGVLVGVVVAATTSYALGGLSVMVGLCAALVIQYAVGRFLRSDGSGPDQ